MARPPRRRGSEERDPPTPADQFLYLLFEMERLVARQLTKWTHTEAAALHARLWCMNIPLAVFLVSPFGSFDPDRDWHAEAGHAV
jgi:hypothetical protein